MLVIGKSVCYTTGCMDDTKKVFAAFLGLLFIIIFIGVFISRIAQEKKDVPVISAIERVFFPNRPTATPEEEMGVEKKEDDTKKSNTVAVEKTSKSTSDSTASDKEEPQKEADKGGSVINEPQAETQVEKGIETESETKGGVKAEEIPAAGTPENVLLFAFGSLISGIFIKRYAKS